jgi:hypothetical protein
MGITKDTKLKLELNAQEINTILDGLSSMPYKLVAPLISKIHDQVKTQSSQQDLPKKA